MNTQLYLRGTLPAAVPNYPIPLDSQSLLLILSSSISPFSLSFPASCFTAYTEATVVVRVDRDADR